MRVPSKSVLRSLIGELWVALGIRKGDESGLLSDTVD